MCKTIFFRGFAALALLSFALTVSAQQKPVRRSVGIYSRTSDGNGNRQYLNIDEDSSVNPPQTYVNYKSDSLYNIVLSGGKAVSIFVNGRQVPASNFYQYDDIIKRIREQMERDREQAVRDRAQAARDQIQAGKDKEQAMRDKEQAERDAKQALRDKEQAEKDSKEAVREKAQAENDREQMMRDKQQAERDGEQALRDKKQAELDKEQAARDKIQAEEDRALVKGLMAELIKEGLVTDEKSVTSLVLDESIFYVNRKKQSDELQKKFKEKFIKKPGYSVHYHNGAISIGRMDD